jgi:T5SS/PEP-CTERM-associated repeat protein
MMSLPTAACPASLRLLLLSILLGGFSIVSPLPSALALITPDGDVFLTDLSAWSSLFDGNIGNTASGTLTIDGAAGLACKVGYIGYASAATGVATVAQSDSTWTPRSLCVGNSGGGTLLIAAGGVLNST